jgi:hypothetical protein
MSPMMLYTILKTLTRSMPQIPGKGRICNWMIDAYLGSNELGRVPVNALGFALHLHPSESVCQRELVFYPELYDRAEIAFLRSVLQPGDIFVDVGAHIGIYSLVASRLVGETGRVLAVEAAPQTAKLLSRHVEINHAQNVIVRQLGVSDSREFMQLEVNPANSGGNRLVVPEAGQEGIECFPLSEPPFPR